MMKRLTDDDWKYLFPSDFVRIGGQEVEIRPFSLAEIARIANLFLSTSTGDIDLADPFRDMAALADMPAIAIIMEMATGIRQEDFRDPKFPGWLKIEILRKIVAVNNQAKEGLVKNLIGLVNGAVMLIGDWEIPSSAASNPATTGQPSKDTTLEKSASSSGLSPVPAPTGPPNEPQEISSVPV